MQGIAFQAETRAVGRGTSRRGEDAKRVLVIDDSPTQLIFAERALRRAGYEVETADNLWVSPLVLRFRPDLVLMDLNLGINRGTSAIQALKNRSFTQGTRFMLFSDTEPEELARLARKCGADGYLHKDGNPVCLCQRVAEMLADEPEASAEAV